MGKISLDSPQKKEIYERFRYLSERHSKWSVWADFITLSACSLCVSNRKQREQEYMSIAKRYNQNEMQQFSEMFEFVVDALDSNPSQDFLGDLFVSFDLSNTWKGQFFTPYHVCQAMSAITAGDLSAQLANQSWISVHDPACGAGATLIAFAEECLRQHRNYQKSVLFVAQDIDRIAALMCFIQLSLLGCPGYIVVGDSFLHPVSGSSLLLPCAQAEQEIWYMPMLHTELWQWRIALEKMKYM